MTLTADAHTIFIGVTVTHSGMHSPHAFHPNHPRLALGVTLSGRSATSAAARALPFRSSDAPPTGTPDPRLAALVTPPAAA